MNMQHQSEQKQVSTRVPALPRYNILQQKCACSGSSGVDRKRAECYQEKLARGRLQTKLTINQPGDKYEQEADNVAKQVVWMAEPESEQSAGITGPSQKIFIHQLSSVDEKVHRQKEDDDENESLQARETPGQRLEVSPELQSRISQMRDGGRPLPASTLTFMEARFGYDFNQVRIHTDAQATQTAQAIKAKAYTVGQDIVFGTGQFTPETTAGKELLAHELTHVVQQEQVSSAVQRQVNAPTQVNTVQAEWEAHPHIHTRYSAWQIYANKRNQVASWTAPKVSDPAGYIEASLEEWLENPKMHSSFGNNFDDDPHHSYLNLRRLYQARGINNPAHYLAANIKDITFYNRKTQGHIDLKQVLMEAETALRKNGHVFTLDKHTWSYVPRTYNDNINKLSNHSLGKAIDIDPGSNPHIKSRKDFLVIDVLCASILPHGLLTERDFATLKKASDYFQTHFNEEWIDLQEKRLSQMKIERPHSKELAHQIALVNALHARRSQLYKYAVTGFLNLPEDLVEGLKRAGLNWGGEWHTSKDFMHFELPNP